jgi:cobalt-zinc-cadmium efflux system membrane fusion protein
MKRSWMVIGAIAFGAALGGTALGLRAPKEATRDPATVAGATPTAGARADLAGVEVAPVETRPLHGEIELGGSVAYDADQYSVVGPLVSGRVVSVRAKLGSDVRAKQTLAEVESLEVGEARGQYMAAKAQAAAAAADLTRERELADKHISSDRDRELAEARAGKEEAAVRVAEQHLRTLGLDPQGADDQSLGGRVSLRAPLSGTVVARDISLGQSVAPGDDAFVVADLTHLWVLLDVFEKDLGRIYVGQPAEIRTEALPGQVMPARVSYIGMAVDTNTRTASVRVEFDNTRRLLRPGQFVSARLLDPEGKNRAPVVVVPRDAVQTLDAKRVVFVRDDNRFVPRPVVLGRSDASYIEVRDGLQAGEEIVVRGAFLVKSQLLR